MPILGGTCEGRERFHDLLTGRVLPGGADWQLIHEEGSPKRTRGIQSKRIAGLLVVRAERGSGTRRRTS